MRSYDTVFLTSVAYRNNPSFLPTSNVQIATPYNSYKAQIMLQNAASHSKAWCILRHSFYLVLRFAAFTTFIRCSSRQSHVTNCSQPVICCKMQRSQSFCVAFCYITFNLMCILRQNTFTSCNLRIYQL